MNMYESFEQVDISILDGLTFSWVRRVIEQSRNSANSISSLCLPQDQKPDVLHKRFWQCWSVQYSLFKALWCVVGHDIVIAAAYKATWSALILMAAIYFVKSILSAMRDAGMYTEKIARWLLVIFFFINTAMLGLCWQKMSFRTLCASNRTAILLTRVATEKAVSLSPSQHDGGATRIVSVVTDDVSKICLAIHQLPFICTSPLEVSVVLALLGYLIGVSALPGIAALCLCFAVECWLGWLLSKQTGSCGSMIHTRLYLMRSVLSSIVSVKSSGLEPYFERRVDQARQQEMKVLSRSALIKAFMFMVVVAIAPLGASAMFLPYALRGGDVHPTMAFTILALLAVVFITFVHMPKAFRAVSDGHAALLRVQHFLMREVMPREGARGTPGVHMASVVFHHPGNNHFQLTVPDFSVRPGELVAVMGQVGSGKSSLVHAILGNLTRTRGDVQVGGRISYVPQHTWCQNLTLKENILFGQNFDLQRYHQTLRACALEHDLSRLPNGEDSLAGVNGINLSRGQRQRLNLARCAYADADLVLLDNALSALDHHTAHHIFRHLIQGMLGNKAVLLITHQLEFLPHCHKVAIMNNGTMQYFGPWCQQAQEALLRLHPTLPDVPATTYTTTTTITTTSAEEVQVVMSPHAPHQTRRNVSSRTGRWPGSSTQHREAKVSMFQALKTLVQEGGLLLGTMVVLLAFATQGARQMCDYWVKLWTLDGLDLKVAGAHRAARLYAVGYISLVGLVAVLALWRTRWLFWHLQRAAQHLYMRMVSRILQAPLSFFLQRPLGHLLVSLSGDQDVLDNHLPEAILYTFIYTTIVLTCTAMVCFQLPWLSILAIALLAATCYVGWLYLPDALLIKKLRASTSGKFTGFIAEMAEGLTIIQAHGQQQHFMDEIARLADQNIRALFTQDCLNAWLAVRCDLLGAAVVVGIAAYSVGLRHSLDPASVGVALNAVIKMQVFYAMMVRTIAEVVSLFSAPESTVWLGNHTDQELGSRKSRDQADGRTSLEVLTDTELTGWPRHGQVVFEEVYIEYGPCFPWALKGVSFQLAPYEKLGVVGRTGSGKTTLVLALTRMLLPCKGQVLLDGVDVTTVPLDHLRRSVTLVPQDPVMFSGTVRDNLDPLREHTDPRLWEVIREVHLAEKVEACGGLDGPVGAIEGAAGAWSLGQQQLCCLARASLRAAPLLCLDEVASSLDPHMEQLVQGVTTRLAQNCTSVVVAHRLNTVLGLDRVMVLESGVMMELDAPKALLAKPGSMFGKLVAQTGMYAAALAEEQTAQGWGLMMTLRRFRLVLGQK